MKNMKTGMQRYEFKQASDSEASRSSELKPCVYIDQMLDPSRQFRQQYSTDFGSEMCQQICTSLFSSLNVH